MKFDQNYNNIIKFSRQNNKIYYNMIYIIKSYHFVLFRTN
jgi:hypothetical protein